MCNVINEVLVGEGHEEDIISRKIYVKYITKFYHTVYIFDIVAVLGSCIDM